MADESGDTKNLGLGVTFIASIAGFQEQLKTIREQLAQFKTDLETMGKTGKEAAEKLTSANKDTEKAITQATTATKAAVAATGEAAKAAESLATGMEKAKTAISGTGGATGKAAIDFKGLSFETMNAVTQIRSMVSEPVLGSLVTKLKNAADESTGYKTGLIGAAKEAGSSTIAFNTLSSALLSNEKYLSTVADGTKKVRSELGAGALPADMKAVVEGVDRLKFAQSTLAGEMYKTGDVVLDGRGKFVELQKTIASLDATHGTAAMHYTDAATRLGSYGTTVQSVTGELKAYNSMVGDAVKINTSLTEQSTKLKAVYGGTDGLANSTGKYREEFDKLVSSLDGSKNKMTTVENDAKRLNGQFVENQKGAASFTKAVAELGDQSPKTAAFVGELTKKINDGNISHAEGAKQVKAHGAELTKIGTTANATSGFWNNLTGKLVGGGAAASTATDYFSRLGTAVASLAAWIPAALIIGGLTEAITSSIQAVKDYDQALKSLQAISGGTEAEISLLGAEMLRISDTTKYSAAEIAKGAIYIAQAGFTAGESLQVISAAARGAQGTLEPLTTAANLLTTVIRAFHIDASEASTVIDMLAMAANKSKTDLEGMKTVFNYLGPAAYSAGVSLNETLGTLMALSNVGMKMSTVGTSLRQVFIGLENPSGRLKKALAELGMTTDDLSVKKMGGLIPVLQNLDKVIGGSLTNAVQYFNVRAGNAALVISQMNSHVAMMIKYTEEYGAAAAMAGTQSEGMAVKLSMLSNQFQNFIIRMAEGGPTNLFKALISAASGLITVIEYLVNNPLAAFLVTTGAMYASLSLLYSIIKSVGVSLAVSILGPVTEAGLATLKALGFFDLLAISWKGLSTAGAVAAGYVTNLATGMVTFSGGTAAATGVVGLLTNAWRALSVAFTTTPIGLIIAGLAVLAATIYTVVTSSDKQSKALQENTIIFANNADSAEKYAAKLREMSVSQKAGTLDSTSYNAVLRQIKETFPEVSKEIVLASGNLDAQAAILEKTAVRYKELNAAAAGNAMADIAKQYRETSVQIEAYSGALLANRNQLTQVALGIGAAAAALFLVVPAFLGSTKASDALTKALVNVNLAFNFTSAQAGLEASEKLSGAMVKQGALYEQAASIIINSSKSIRESLIAMIPEGDMKKAALGAVAIHDAMVASLKVGTSELVKKEIDAVADMGASWIKYYEQQDELGRADVARYAELAKKKVAGAMKEFKKGTDDNKLIMIEQERLEAESFQKMLDARGKYINDLLTLEDKLYEEQHKRRKAALDLTLGQLDLAQKQEITNLANMGLAEGDFLTKKEALEKLYYDKSKLAIDTNTTLQLASLESIHQAKLKSLEMDTTLTEEAKKGKLVTIETENSVKLIAIYTEQLAAFKTHISEKVAEFNKYKTEYDKVLAAIKRAEEDNLKALEAAHKAYLRAIADADLAYTKQTEDLDKIRRDARQSTMTAYEVMVDKTRELNDTLAKGYAALAEAEKASDLEAKKGKIKAATDYFNDAKGMISGLATETKGADGVVIISAQDAANKKIAAADTIQKAYEAVNVATRALAKEDQLAAATESETKKNKIVADLNLIAEASKKNMASVNAEIGTLMTKYNDVVKLVADSVKIKADTTEAFAEIKKLTDKISLGKAAGDFNVVLKFMGEASPAGPLDAIIEEVKLKLQKIGQFLKEEIPTFIIYFKGSSDGVIADVSATVSQVVSRLKEVKSEISGMSLLDIVIRFLGLASPLQGISDTIDGVKSKLADLGNTAQNVKPTNTTTFVGVDGSTTAGVSDTINSVGQKIDGLTDKINNADPTYTIKTKVEGVGSGYSGYGDPKNVFVSPWTSFMNGMANPFSVNAGFGSEAWNRQVKLRSMWQGETLAEFHKKYPDAGYAEGGVVPGSGEGDSVPAMLTPGEFVVNKSAVATFGEGFLHMVNNMKSFAMPKMNMGGMVQAFANGGPVRSNEVFTLNLQAGVASLPLKVMGNSGDMRNQIRMFEKELSRMRLSHG